MKCWFKDGKLHRKNGPAIEYNDGTTEWWAYGKIHREDGPAIEHADGTKQWWLGGKKMKINELNLIVCHYCKSKFKSKDKVYTITAREFDINKYNFTELYLDEKIKTEKEILIVRREINFHKKCFEEVAGRDYMP